MIAPPKPPSRDELEALIKEARARHLRPRLLGAAGVAVAAAIGLAIYASLIGGTTSNDGRPSAEGRSGGAPLCLAAQLSATGGLNGAVGTMLGPVTLANTGSNACSLPTGRPRVTILWRDRALPVRETTAGTGFSGETHARVLVPHSRAVIYMRWSNWCGKPREGTIIRPTFRLRWADGVVVDALNNKLTPPRCGSPAGGSQIAVGVPVKG
jgi:hypothetical protein